MWAGANNVRVHPLVWRKSSASATDNCVEVAAHRDTVYVRDSKDPDGAVLAFSAAAWRRFLSGVTAPRV